MLNKNTSERPNQGLSSLISWWFQLNKIALLYPARPALCSSRSGTSSLSSQISKLQTKPLTFDVGGGFGNCMEVLDVLHEMWGNIIDVTTVGLIIT